MLYLAFFFAIFDKIRMFQGIDVFPISFQIDKVKKSKKKKNKKEKKKRKKKRSNSDDDSDDDDDLDKV